jgi:hypothetical protein
VQSGKPLMSTLSKCSSSLGSLAAISGSLGESHEPGRL